MKLLHLLGTHLEFDETSLPQASKAIGELSREESAPVVILGIKRGDIACDIGEATFGIQARSQLEISAINQSNPGTVNGSNGNIAEGEPLVFPDSPWTFRKNPTVGLSYQLCGDVSSGFGANRIPVGSFSSASFGIQADTRISAGYLNLHHSSSQLEEAVESDLKDYHFSLNPDCIEKLKPGREYLISEFQANFAFDTELSWGQLFHTNSSLLRALSPANDALHIKGSAGAFASFKVGIHSRLQLITFLKNRHTARVEFRKARRNIQGIDAGIEVRVGIANPTAIDDAIDRLLAEALEFRPEVLTQLRTRLTRIREQWNADRIGDLDLRHLVNSQIERLGISPSTFLQQLEIGAWFERSTTELAKARGFLENELQNLHGALERFHQSITPDHLDGELPRWARGILLSLDLEDSDLPLLAALICEPDFRSHLVQRIPNLDGTTLDQLQINLGNQLSRFSIERVTEKRPRQLLELVEEEYSITIDEIGHRFRAGKLLQQLSGNANSFQSIDKLHQTIALTVDSILENEQWIVEVAEKLTKHFGIGEWQLGEKLEELSNMTKQASREQIRLSATMEFSWLETNEALFAFDFRQIDKHASTFKDVYRNLLAGDLRFAIQTCRDNEQLFDHTEFFEAESLAKRRSVQLRFFAKQGKSHEQKQSSICNINGERKVSFSESLSLNGGVMKRDWRTYFVFNADSKEFLQNPDASTFDFCFETGLYYTGKVHPKPFFKKIAKNNRNAILFMGRILADCPKSSFTRKGMGYHLTQEMDASSKAPAFRIDLKMSDHALRWFWSSLENQATLARHFDNSWLSTRHDLRIFANKSEEFATVDARRALDEFGRIREVIDRKSSPEDLRKHMMLWSGHYRDAVRDISGRDFVFKFCFLHALVQTLPADLAGWSVTGMLQIQDQEHHFG